MQCSLEKIVCTDLSGVDCFGGVSLTHPGAGFFLPTVWHLHGGSSLLPELVWATGPQVASAIALDRISYPILDDLVQAELPTILPHPPHCWGYRHEPLRQEHAV